jgi:hypothetical protein
MILKLLYALNCQRKNPRADPGPTTRRGTRLETQGNRANTSARNRRKISESPNYRLHRGFAADDPRVLGLTLSAPAKIKTRISAYKPSGRSVYGSKKTL